MLSLSIIICQSLEEVTIQKRRWRCKFFFENELSLLRRSASLQNRHFADHL